MHSGKITAVGKFLFGSALVTLIVAAYSAGAACLFAQATPSPRSSPERVVARVNGAAITEVQLLDETESLYPFNTAHGGLQPEKLQEIRNKALEELIVQELAYQQAVKSHTLVPMMEVRAEYRRMRTKYSVKEINQSLRASGLTSEQYLKRLQRRMTLARVFQQKVVLPSRMSAQALRSYYQQNLKKFQRPEQVHARLILAAVDPKSGPEVERQAHEKIQKVYQELQAGKDFSSLAEQYSDDFYRVKGGDLGWTHRGRLEPDFEKVAFSLPVGRTSEPFRTPYGYNLMKVEDRQPARQMKYEEVRGALKAELEQKRMVERRQEWVAQLKKGAQIEILESSEPPRASH